MLRVRYFNNRYGVVKLFLNFLNRHPSWTTLPESLNLLFLLFLVASRPLLSLFREDNSPLPWSQGLNLRGRGALKAEIRELRGASKRDGMKLERSINLDDSTSRY